MLECSHVRPGHVVALGLFVPRLRTLVISYCPGLHLDETEVQLLTPPAAPALPQLCHFQFASHWH